MNHATKTQKHFINITNTIRLTMVVALLIFHIFFSNEKSTSIPYFESVYIYIWLLIYTILIIVIAVYPKLQEPSSSTPSIIGFIDITMIAVLMWFSGGVASGFGILLLTMLTMACLNQAGKHSMTYAAYTTILIISSTLLPWDDDFPLFNNNKNLFQAGLLSISCFFIGSLSTLLTKNIRKSLNNSIKNEKQIKRLNYLNQLIINYAQGAVVVMDEHANIMQFNNQALRYFPFLKLNQSTGKFNPIINQWRQGLYDSFSFEYCIDGQSIVVHADPLTDQKPPLLLLFIRSSADIAEEVQSLKLAALGQLTANLAHEIRNPLSSIIHANELLQESLIDDNDRYLKQIIEKNAHRINVMITEVLSLHKRSVIETSKIQLQTFFVDFLSNFYLSIPDSQHSIVLEDIDSEWYVFADEHHLYQILNNLLNNAWKFCSQGNNAIRIMTQFNPIEEKLSITIKDDGPGVSEDAISHLFEPFFTTSEVGSGLGLYIARELTFANKGKLSYQNNTQVFELILKAQKDVS